MVGRRKRSSSSSTIPGRASVPGIFVRPRFSSVLGPAGTSTAEEATGRNAWGASLSRRYIRGPDGTLLAEGVGAPISDSCGCRNEGLSATRAPRGLPSNRLSTGDPCLSSRPGAPSHTRQDPAGRSARPRLRSFEPMEVHLGSGSRNEASNRFDDDQGLRSAPKREHGRRASHEENPRGPGEPLHHLWPAGGEPEPEWQPKAR